MPKSTRLEAEKHQLEAEKHQFELEEQSLEHAFQVLYGVEASLDHKQRLRGLGVLSKGTGLVELLRRIKPAMDSIQFPARVLVPMNAESVTWIDQDGFRMAVDDADVAVSQYLIGSGGWEPHMTALFNQILKPGMAVIDAGANVGYYTLLAAHLVGPHGRVTAFEPNSENCRLVLLSRAANGFENISLLPLALSDHTGYASFCGALGSNGGFRSLHDEQLHNPSCQIVPVMRLDDVYKDRVDFIKMDIEGAEPLALEGAARTLEKWRPVVSSEYSPFMMRSIAGSDPRSFFESFSSRRYNAFLLDKASYAEIPITDWPDFVANYGSDHRIEDLLFRPQD